MADDVKRAPARGADAVMRAYDGPVPGASVLGLHDGVAAVRHNYGFAELERSTAVKSTTAFRLASITKQFTAAAVLLLMEEGRITLDDRVRGWLPSLPGTHDGMTIRHLLTHTGGIIDYEDLLPLDCETQVRDADVLELQASESRLYFAPGGGWRYSNGGYALLALVVERASGQSFPAFLADRIFGPLDMRNTLAYVRGGPSVPNRAFGYSLNDGKWQPTDQDATSAVLGDGGIYSCVEDLAKWDAALYDDRLLSRESRRLAFTPWTATDDPGIAYGFGWRIANGTLWHSGESVGFRNALVRWPARKTTVIVLSNRNEGEPYRLALDIADQVTNQEVDGFPGSGSGRR